MKKYTNYKISLCIGLLSLNILSSCTNMRQELGVKKRQDKSSSCAQWCLDSHTLQNWKNAPCYSRCLCIPCLKQPLVRFIGSVFTLVVVGGLIYWVSSQPNAPITSDSVLPNCWNETGVLSRTARSISLSDTMSEEQGGHIIGFARDVGVGVLGTLGALRALYNRNDNNATSRNTRSVPLYDDTMSAKKGDRIIRYIRDVEEKFGSNDTDSNTTEPTTTESVTTTQQPSGGVAAGKIMFIGDKTMKVFNETDYKNELVECLVEDGLHANAKDSKGCHLYSLVQKNKQEGEEKIALAQYLIEQGGADLNPNLECRN